MRRQILVPIKRHDRIEDILPYLEDMARPDAEIVFLVRLDARRFSERAGQFYTIQRTEPGDGRHSDSVPQHEPGVQIEVKFYSGRLRPLLRQFSEIEGTKLAIMRPTIIRAKCWLRGLIAGLGIVRPSTMPVRLGHPADFTSRDL